MADLPDMKPRSRAEEDLEQFIVLLRTSINPELRDVEAFDTRVSLRGGSATLPIHALVSV